ncbi:MAG: glycosyltransferase, partial [Solirubrobacterales bacterium]
LGAVPFDIVHVHEPFGPSLSAGALRHSLSLNVGTFHDPQERLLSTHIARPLVEIFFGRLDVRTVTSEVTGELLRRYFPGSYDLVPPGADSAERVEGDGPLRIAFCLEEERGALRLFLRALRRLPPDLDWRASVWSADGADAASLRISRRLRQRVEVVGPGDCEVAELMARSDVAVAASGGPAPAPGVIRRALAAGVVPVVSRLPIYVELVAEGELGPMFQPGDAETLAGQLARLGADRSALERLRKAAAAAGPARGWAQVADDFEVLYTGATSRRHDPSGDPAVRRRISRRKLIEVDLHMHTDHSPDCATPVEVLLETARDRGLGAIAITDHNEVSGALAAQEIAAGMDDLKVIVAEEVKTAEQGEVIGLFLTEKIPRGLTMAETIAEIRRQGGLV